MRDAVSRFCGFKSGVCGVAALSLFVMAAPSLAETKPAAAAAPAKPAAAAAPAAAPAAPAAKPAAAAPAPAAAAPAPAAAAAPAAGAPAATAAAGAAAGVEPSKSAWVKLCEKAPMFKKDKDGKDVKEEKNLCLTHHERLDGNTGMVLVSAAIREVEGSDKPSLMVMVPLGMAIPPGIRAFVYTKEQWAAAQKNEKIDEKTLKPIELKYSLCHPAGCTAETDASKEIIDSMKTGGGIMVLSMNAAAQPIGFPVPLDGFTEAQAGAPIDNEKYRQARGQLMKSIQEHQQKLAAEQSKVQGVAIPMDKGLVPATTGSTDGAAAPAAKAPAAAAAPAASPKK